MHCMFCGKKLGWYVKGRRAEDKELKDIPEFSKHKCDTCKAEFTFYAFIGQVTDYSLEADNGYRLDMNLTDGSCEVQRIQNYHEDIPIWNTVLRLEHSPQHISPKNVNEKLKTILVFS